MFIKSILSYIFAPILLVVSSIFGGGNTQVYVAPETTEVYVAEKASSTPKENLVATTSVVIEKQETKQEAKKVQATTTKPIVKPMPTPLPETPKTPEPTPNFEQINTFARQSVVNILCTTKGGELSPISGTGIVVKPDGLIITNAHIAQYLLLKDFTQKDFVQCVIRTGSPAYPKYNIELVYISPTWISNNKTVLKQQNPQGTGENDFAFLRITKNIDNSNLPEKFPFIQMDIRENIELEEPVLLASYPAGFLGGLSILQDLNIVTSITSIREVFTFKEQTIDLISVPGTVVSQKGSSGGAVVDKYSTLLGLISTSSDGNSTKDRDLRAITMAYVNRDMQKELGITLEQFVNGDSSVFAKKFQEINVPTLTKIITDELMK